jgi:hypothetical protein
LRPKEEGKRCQYGEVIVKSSKLQFERREGRKGEEERFGGGQLVAVESLFLLYRRSLLAQRIAGYESGRRTPSKKEILYRDSATLNHNFHHLTPPNSAQSYSASNHAPPAFSNSHPVMKLG